MKSESSIFNYLQSSIHDGSVRVNPSWDCEASDSKKTGVFAISFDGCSLIILPQRSSFTHSCKWGCRSFLALGVTMVLF